MKYIYIDGDNIGLSIEQSFLNNEEQNLREINQNVISAISKISDFLVENNCEIIFAGADGVIAKGININNENLLKFTRSVCNDLTFSIGISDSLKGCYIALRYAKSESKNILTEYSNNTIFKTIR